MITFDASKLSIKYVQLKSVTTALGGSIVVLDEVRSKTQKKEVFKKVNVPLAVARQFMKRYAVRQYMKPIRTAMAMYDTRCVALEREPFNASAEANPNPVLWTADMESAVRNFLKPLVNGGEKWYIDGTYVYSMPQYDTFEQFKSVSADKHFNEIRVSAVKLADLSTSRFDKVDERVCLMYEANNGERMISPPIWTSLSIIGTTQFNKQGASFEGDSEDIGEDMEVGEDHFDRVDEYLCVNLAFVLKAARELVQIFGFDSIEPFNLPALMLQMKTVNLPNVSNSVKQTYDSGIPFTHATAWLLGMLRKTESLESYLTIRSLMKHLTTKGVYRKNAFDLTSVYRTGHGTNSVPLKSIEQAATTVANFSSLQQFTEAQAALDNLVVNTSTVPMMLPR